MNILPVIVIYKIRLSESDCYRHFLSRIPVRQFMVYDNSPVSFASDEVMPKSAIYVRDTSNGGVSVAYNTAAKYALQNGFERILLLDQDTLFPISMYEEMMRCESDICAPRIVLKNGQPFSPTAWKHGALRGVRLPSGEYALGRYMLVNSGLCVSVKLFMLAGGYNEKVKLDFADFQFMHRLRRVTDCFTLLDAEAEQDFSNEQTDVSVLYARYCKYIEGARHFETYDMKDKLLVFWSVFLHTLALTKRTGKMLFVKKLLLGDKLA